MKLNYLSADVPLSKSYEEVAPGQFKETSYPAVSRFSSVERSVDCLATFYEFTIAAAAEGLCLLKGRLDRPLRGESRAGHTDSSSETRWICLDVDRAVYGYTPTEFLDGLDSSFQDVSFIFQYSAGHGIKSREGWRGHFFLLLDDPKSPQALKAWLTHLNLSLAVLLPQVGLSASGGALTYPLDTTTCQNDKLLFIAPPTCKNFDDPVPDRFELVERKHSHLHLQMEGISAAQNDARKKEKIAELRAAASLPKKTIKTTQRDGFEIMTNPDPMTVTGKKEERGFVYLNLNGGDSWAYYFPTSNPEILFNFKGEPCLYLKDVDQSVYTEYKYAPPTESAGACAFGFLCRSDDQYYRGFANPDTQQIDWLLATGSKNKLRDFFVQNGVHLPRGWAVDEWDLCFDPTSQGYADFVAQEVNTYQQTEYIANAKTVKSGIPPIIDKVITSVCVNEEVKAYFLNWIAYIFQTRNKTNTAWIFQGVQGTGKGVLFTHILSPLFGREYCHEMTMDRLDDDFNAYLTENIILFIDEANISDSRDGDRLFNRIKNLITEPKLHIRSMRTNAILRDNFSNIILASNYDEILPLDATDRRFNVAPRQESPIQLEYEDVIGIERELDQFANFLHSYSVDASATSKVLITDARQRLIDVNKTTIDDFFMAVRSGNLGYFTQYLDGISQSDAESFKRHDYALVVKRWVNTLGENKDCNIPRDELRACYQFLQNASISPTKFNRMCRKYDLESDRVVRIDGNVTRGIYKQKWNLSSEELEHLQGTQETSNVVKLPKTSST